MPSDSTQTSFCEGNRVRIVRSEIFPGAVGKTGVVDKAARGDAGRIPVVIGKNCLYFKPGDLEKIK